jgi:hypothetical protein
VQVGKSDLHRMLLSMCEFHENRRTEGQHFESERHDATVCAPTRHGTQLVQSRSVFTAQYELSRETSFKSLKSLPIAITLTSSLPIALPCLGIPFLGGRAATAWERSDSMNFLFLHVIFVSKSVLQVTPNARVPACVCAPVVE